MDMVCYAAAGPAGIRGRSQAFLVTVQPGTRPRRKSGPYDGIGQLVSGIAAWRQIGPVPVSAPALEWDSRILGDMCRNHMYLCIMYRL